MSLHGLITGTMDGNWPTGPVARCCGRIDRSKRPGEQGRLIARNLEAHDDNAVKAFIGALPIARLDVLINKTGMCIPVRSGPEGSRCNAPAGNVGGQRHLIQWIVRHALASLKCSDRPTIVNVSSTMGLLSTGVCRAPTPTECRRRR